LVGVVYDDGDKPAGGDHGWQSNMDLNRHVMYILANFGGRCL
jgi:hypothetical protein